MAFLNTILVVLDGSDGDATTVAHAVELASGFGASIELFSCVLDEVVASERAFDSKDLDATKLALLEQRRQELEDIAKPLVDEGLPVATSVAWDKPAYKGVVRRVLALNPRLVVRHRQFHASIKRSVFTNDDWNLIRTCPVPLLITRERPWKHESPHIWAAVDPVHEHDKPAALDDIIVRTGRALSTALGGTLNVLHMYDSSYAMADAAMRALGSSVLSGNDISELVKKQHSAAMDELAVRTKLHPGQVHMIAGSARKMLPGAKIGGEADILVLGAVARSRLKKATIGGTAEQVLDRLPCDVLVVKPDEFQSPVGVKPRLSLQSVPTD